MGKEIERKFLVTGDDWQEGDGTHYCQGYLSIAKERTVRVRIEGDSARFTIKGITENATRDEYEYPLPVSDAREILENLCLRPLVEKRRYRIDHEGMTWEVDAFSGDNAGLVVAEIELEDPDQEFTRPPWLGREVTGDPRYYNANLVRCPFRQWQKPDQS
jgi:CYTH domain-containing protein